MKMTGHRFSVIARFLALVVALPWSVFAIDPRGAAGAPAGTTPAVVSVGDNAAVVTGVPADRKPIAKCERSGLDGTLGPAAGGRLLAPRGWLGRGGVDAIQNAYVNHSSCACLCRFLV